MLCFLCGKKIGFLRVLVDQQYCCSDHRKEARLVSSRALRDEEDLELWSVSKSRKKQQVARSATSAGQTASIMAFMTVGALLVAALMLPGPSTPAAPTAVSFEHGFNKGFFERAGDSVAEVIRSTAPVTFHHDFQSGMADWTTTALRETSRLVNSKNDVRDLLSSAASNIVSPGSLRIWDRSVSMTNYQLEFQGQIEKKSLSWAFRASDPKNYYATKLLITKPGPLPNAGLVRYVMINGHEWDRVQLPLPLRSERGGNYRVRVSVQDDHFITYLNGQVISSWTDKRLRRGGVGFFADEDDPQQVAWVDISERDSLIGRVLAHFSLIVMPGIVMPGLGPNGLPLNQSGPLQ